MFVHRMKTGQHRAEILRADGNHRRKANRRIHRIPAADPIPKPKHIFRINAEFLHLSLIGRDRDEMFVHR